MKHISDVRVQVIVPCEDCGGAGRIAEGFAQKVCATCAGLGELHRKITLTEFKELLLASADPDLALAPALPSQDPEDATT